jgi:hypothetical protein
MCDDTLFLYLAMSVLIVNNEMKLRSRKRGYEIRCVPIPCIV